MTKSRVIKNRKVHSSWWFLLAILVLAGGIRYRLLDVPMERDEGEYAYGAQLLLRGLLPYEHLYNMKLPGIYAAYAAIISIFGQTQTGVHTGLLLVNALTSILVFLLARRLFNPLAGVVAAGSFSILSLGQPVQGMFANAEHFVILPAAGGLLLLLLALDKERLSLFFSAGLLLGLGFIMKQHGITFIMAGGALFLVHQLRNRPLSSTRLWGQAAALLSGIGLPYLTICLLFLTAGSFDQFWFWTYTYSMKYTAQIPFLQGIARFAPKAIPIVSTGWPIWLLAATGLSAVFWNNDIRKCGVFLAIFALCSFMAICPGFFFRPHYFVLLLPCVAILAGAGVHALTALRPSPPYSAGILLISLSLAFTLFQQRDFLFWMSPATACRSTYGINPFPESLVIADYIRSHTDEEDRIAVIGSEPQIYFYSGRQAATGYIYTYAMMEEHEFARDMQSQMIKEITEAKPEYIVYIDPLSIPTSWLPHRDSHLLLIRWFHLYAARHYTRVGLVDVFQDGSRYRWDEEVTDGLVDSPYWVEILKRKTPDNPSG